MWADLASYACQLIAMVLIFGCVMYLMYRSKLFWRICERIARDGSTELYVHRPDKSPVEQYHERKRREAADRLREGR